MCLHFTLAHKLVVDNGEEDYLFPVYAKRLKYNNTNKIDSKTSNIFHTIVEISFQYQRNMINRLITLKTLILDVSFISIVLKYYNISKTILNIFCNFKYFYNIYLKSHNFD